MYDQRCLNLRKIKSKLKRHKTKPKSINMEKY